MSLLYFIISCEDLRPPLYSRFRHATFSFVDCRYHMYSSPFALFHTWECSGLVFCNGTLELYVIVFSLYHFYLLAIRTSWMRDGTMSKYRKIACILNLTEGRTKNRIDLLPNFRLIDMKIISLPNHSSCYLYCYLGASAFTF